LHDVTRRYLIALVLLAGAAVWANLLWSRQAPEAAYKPRFGDIPLQIGELKGEKIPVEQRIFNYLGADAMEEIMYAGDDRSVRLSVVYGTDWRAVHSPLSCLPQMGWQVDKPQMVDLPAPPGTPHEGPLHGQLLLAHKGQQRQAVMYLFAHKGGTTGDWKAQGWAVNRTPRGTGGLLISASTPIARAGDTAAINMLKEVCSSVYLPATSFWYTK